MKCITIQDKRFYNKLMRDGFITANEKRIQKKYIKPYDLMKNTYGWEYSPIFLSPIAHRVDFSGVVIDKNSIAIELDIPYDKCRLQNYYDWLDIIYFSGVPDMWEDIRDDKTLSMFNNSLDWSKYILNRTNEEVLRHGINLVLQASCQWLQKDWVTDTLNDLDKLIDLHYDSGGNYVLRELKHYK